MKGPRSSSNALHESEERFRVLVESIPQLVFTATPAGRFDYFNQRWLDYTGLTLQQSHGQGWQSALHPDDRPLWVDRWQHSISSGEPLRLEYRLHRARDDRHRWHLCQATSLSGPGGRITRWLGTCTDIEDQKTEEQKRSELLLLEQRGRAFAEAASQAKDQFLATVSHELRTPLTAILGYTHLLRTRPHSPNVTAGFYEKIERNAVAQAQLIDDLLDISRLVNGKLVLDRRPVSLQQVIHAAMDSVRLAADARGVQIELQPFPKHDWVYGDSNRLQQVIWNLFSNSIKFTPPGGNVSVSLQREGSQLLLRVSDNGQGISPEFLPYVFDRFRQADGSSTRQYGGLGLGLAIVKQVVELHGGTVQGQSAGLGQGATFSIRLPLAAERDPGNSELSGEVAPPASDDSSAADPTPRS